jgi:hypothetical protein
LTARNYLLCCKVGTIPLQVYEIHKYKAESFMYIVARTNKHSEEYVRGDVDRMNSMLTPEMRSDGIRYAFALGTIESMNKKTGDRSRKKDKQSESISSELLA